MWRLPWLSWLWLARLPVRRLWRMWRLLPALGTLPLVLIF
jgi:hypothetical protein